MNLGLDMSLKLQQKLSFQMIQSLKLLQINTLQLEQLLKTELEMNPVLEASDEIEAETEEAPEPEQEQQEDPKDEVDEDLKASEDDIDWEEYLEEGFDLGYSYNEERDPNEERYEPATVYQEMLEEHLTKQLAEKKIPEKLLLMIRFLIGSLDADGYLRIDIQAIADFTQVSVYDVEEALHIVQTMDPPGVGSRNLRECMMLQLRARGQHEGLAMRIIDETWDLFERMKIPELSRKYGVEPRQIQEAIEVLKTLNPKPGAQYAADKSSTIIPDLIVEKIDGKYIVMLNDRSIPSLHISNAYAKLLKKGSSAKGDVKKYIREKFNGATWLIRSIEQRKNTMLRVMYAIIERQQDFFEKGPPNINPLKLQDIADMIDMHISTVSRVTSNKYVQTRHGIFELKYFFTEAISQQTGSGAADVSTERIKNRIKEMIEHENTSEPLSDQKIAEQLKKEGMAVARRTVAKYREHLKLLPARLRLKYV
ncbi:MAG: RNA polymerase factor sigma-54 [Chitinispirillaceae bacterium]|nr:RNA polymerase factor sigma-54 [Chitinispirillaceae bacterium]